MNALRDACGGDSPAPGPPAGLMVCWSRAGNAWGMRGKLRVVAVTAMAVGVLAPAAEAQDAKPVWAACAGVPQQECAAINVPLDYGNPGGKRISLAISRIRTARPELRRGALLLIPGGPGNSGLTRPAPLGAK